MGILRTPGEVAAHIHSAPLFLLVWILGGCYALLGAMCLAELGAMRPRAGGIYPLVHDALGPFPGFVAGWTDWISGSGAMAAVAIVLGEYVGPLISGLDGHAVFIASAVVIGFAVLQWRVIRIGNVVQLITSLLKGVALIAPAIVALVMVVPTAPATGVVAVPVVHPAGLALFAAIVVSLQSSIFTYDGWTGPLYFGEELRNHGREMPRSMIGGVLLRLLIYLLLNMAFLRVVGIDSMAGDPFMAATMASRLFGPAGDTVLRILMVVSLLATVNAINLMGSRNKRMMVVWVASGRLAPGKGFVRLTARAGLYSHQSCIDSLQAIAASTVSARGQEPCATKRGRLVCRPRSCGIALLKRYWQLTPTAANAELTSLLE